MSVNTSIEWTDRTWNPLVAELKREIAVKLKSGKVRTFAAGTRGWFCTKCSEGCANCYAQTINFRLGNGLLYSASGLTDIEFKIAHLNDPFRWRKSQLVFVNSMTDLFHEAVHDSLIDDVMATITAAPQHTFQVLTKRARRMRDYFNDSRTITRIRDSAWCLYGKGEPLTLPLPNLWLGVSVENQARADERIPHLLDTPAAVRFLSCEPLLGPLDLKLDFERVCDLATKEPHAPQIHWVIAGGESGPKARPMHLDWARSLRDQCAAADVAFFFKQWGESAPVDQVTGEVREWSTEHRRNCGRFGAASRWEGVKGEILFTLCGKARAGRRLDGIEHNGFPDLHTKGTAA